MDIHQTPFDRRLLVGTLGMLVAGTALNNRMAFSSAPLTSGGTPGDFDFLTGDWKISNRRLKTTGNNEWDEFEGEATCWSFLKGIGSIEELRIPSRNFSGMGLRLLDVEKKQWNDFWVNGKSGVLTCPGQTGVFENGVGTFEADDKDGDLPIKVRGIWDKITPISCRWRQAVSRDNGKTWQENWQMDWRRVKLV